MAIRCFVLLSLVVLAGLAPGVRADDKPRGGHEGMESKPGPIHEKLAKLAGDYTFVSKFRAQPNAEPQETSGTATLSMMLDGRFLREENSGEMLGQKYKGVRIYGYNSDVKRFEGVWMYTGSVAMMNLVGKSDDEGKSVNWVAEAETANGKMKLDVITRVVDEDHFVVEMIAKLPNGEKGPAFESTYTRKK